MGSARRGVMSTPHGEVETPNFMPVGTRAAVKTVDVEDLRSVGAQIVLANTYHLMLRPGERVVAALGELHGFMAWDGPILTDSGGFSGAVARPEITEHGLTFRRGLRRVVGRSHPGTGSSRPGGAGGRHHDGARRPGPDPVATTGGRESGGTYVALGGAFARRPAAARSRPVRHHPGWHRYRPQGTSG